MSVCIVTDVTASQYLRKRRFANALRLLRRCNVRRQRPSNVTRVVTEERRDLPRDARAPHRDGQEFDIEGWVARHGLVERFGLGEWEDWKPADGGQGEVRVFRTCPWSPDHTNSSAYLIRFQDGAIAAGCHHDSCGDKDWPALRDVVEPGWREVEDARGGNARPRPADIIVMLAMNTRIELFHTPGSDGDGFVGIPVENHLQAYDNLSSLRPWLADGLCRMATGGGFATRQLYADDAETIIDVMRPVMINGIDEVSTRSDFLDRAVTLTLPSIGRGRRRTEEDVEAEFERRRPRIFGSLLTALSAALRKLPDIRIEDLPRMADFAKFGVAAEAGLGLPEGAFLRAYEENRRSTHDVALDASPIVPFLMEIMKIRDVWTGTSRDLLQMMEMRLGVDGQRRRARGWPETPKQLTSTLKRIATNLRASGFEATFGAHGRAGIEITIARIDSSSRPHHLRSAPFSVPFSAQIPAQLVSPGMPGIAAVAV